MIDWLLRFRVWSLCFLAVLALTTRAQAAGTGKIIISVHDGDTNALVSLARVILVGPAQSSQFSGQNGQVIFQDSPIGIYRARIAKDGYIQLTTDQFEVLDGQIVSIEVSLARVSPIKTLGSVVVRSTAAISATTISSSSAIRKLSGTLIDALGKLSGVTLRTDLNTGAQVVSLGGRAAGISINGAPVNAAGSSTDLRSINTDLFGSVSADEAHGTINFESAQPTKTWQGQLSTSLGTSGKAATTATIQGSIGTIGIAITQSVRGEDSPLDGLTFLDTSGLKYVHRGANLSRGSLYTLQGNIGKNHSLAATFMWDRGYHDRICTTFTGPLPCGYGPGNYSNGGGSFFRIGDVALLGLTTLSVGVSTNSFSDTDNELARYVGGVAAPFATKSKFTFSETNLETQFPSRQRHTFSIDLNGFRTATNYVPLIASAAPFTGAVSPTSTTLLSLNDSIKSNTKLTLTESIGIQHSTGDNSNSSLTTELNAQWSPTTRDQYTGDVSFGSFGVFSVGGNGLSDPASLQFDCNASIAFGSGKNEVASGQGSTGVDARWQHQLSSGGNISLSLRRTNGRGTPLFAEVNASALPPSYFPPGYFALAQSIFQSIGGCDSKQLFGPSNLYLESNINGVRSVEEEAQFGGTFGIGHALIAQAAYTIDVNKVESHDPRLDNPYSVTIFGSQLPNRPLHSANIVLDYRPRRSVIEWLLDANYTSANNYSNLPAHVVADAGLAVTFEHGTLVLAASNIFNAYPGLFATSVGAVPLSTFSGRPLATVAYPVGPRQMTATFSIKFGHVPSPLPTPNQ